MPRIHRCAEDIKNGYEETNGKVLGIQIFWYNIYTKQMVVLESRRKPPSPCQLYY